MIFLIMIQINHPKRIHPEKMKLRRMLQRKKTKIIKIKTKTKTKNLNNPKIQPYYE